MLKNQTNLPLYFEGKETDAACIPLCQISTGIFIAANGGGNHLQWCIPNSPLPAPVGSNNAFNLTTDAEIIVGINLAIPNFTYQYCAGAGPISISGTFGGLTYIIDITDWGNGQLFIEAHY
jgi:hypothetical protein